MGLLSERKIISFNIYRLWAIFISRICHLITRSTYHYGLLKKKMKNKKKRFSPSHLCIFAHGVSSPWNSPFHSCRLNPTLPSSSCTFKFLNFHTPAFYLSFFLCLKYIYFQTMSKCLPTMYVSKALLHLGYSPWLHKAKIGFFPSLNFHSNSSVPFLPECFIFTLY